MPEFPAEPVRDEVAQLLSHPLHFPDEFKRWMGDYITVNVPLIPFSHIFGSKVNIARSGNYVAASETPSVPGTYGDMTTVGPQITGLADGKYLFAYGFKSRGQGSLSFNGSTPEDDDSLEATESVPTTGRLIMKTLQNNDNNTVKVQYKGVRAFQDRWLMAIRVGSPGQ